MIPTIGVMIGFYIFTRMLELLVNKETGGGVAVFAVITMIVDVLCVISLLFSGSSVR